MKVGALAVLLLSFLVFLAYGQNVDRQDVQTAFKKHVTLRPPYPQSYKDAPVDRLSVQYAVIVSYIRQGWNNGPCIRIQIRQGKGHLLQGPDIPVAQFGETVGAAITLLSKATQGTSS